MPNNKLHHFIGDLNKSLPLVTRGRKNHLYLGEEKRWVLDGSGGAAVSSLGHDNKNVIKAIKRQLKSGTPYLSSAYWTNEPVKLLSKKLISTTEGKFSRVYLTGSGSEAMEAALKLSRQYFYSKDNNTLRTKFISRERSYHGNTLGSLSVSHFNSRRAPFQPLLLSNVHFVSSCYPYRQRLENENNEQFVSRKATELENKFIELGPNTVIGFIAEPVVGAALGCVSFVPGYLKAMQEVCHKHGALLILDEVMCGIGRTGYFHAWQREQGLTPDVQTMAKGLGSGYQAIGAVMVSPRVVEAFEEQPFVHGQTFESMPLSASVALEVLNTIQKKDLITKVSKRGGELGKYLKKSLGNHPNVGDIRGEGLFWGIEFVQDRLTKKPFDSKEKISYKIKEMALSPEFGLAVYMGTGIVDGINGDHIMISPSFLITKKEISTIVSILTRVIERVFENVDH